MENRQVAMDKYVAFSSSKYLNAEELCKTDKYDKYVSREDFLKNVDLGTSCEEYLGMTFSEICDADENNDGIYLSLLKSRFMDHDVYVLVFDDIDIVYAKPEDIPVLEAMC